MEVRKTQKRSLPLHFFLDGTTPGKDTLLSAVQWINEERISALWMDVHASWDIEIVKTLTSLFDGAVITGVVNPSLIGPILENGCSGIVFSPTGRINTSLFVKEILRHRKALERKEGGVYLPVLQTAIGNGVITETSQTGISASTPADAPPGTPQDFSKNYLVRIHETLLVYKKLRNEGIKIIYLNIEHENPVFIYNLCRQLKEQSNTKHIFTLSFRNGSEEDFIKSALSLGPLFYNGIGEALLIKLTPALPLNMERIRKASHSARLILRSLNLAPTGLRMISCPACGRCSMDLTSVAHQVEQKLRELEERLRNEGKRAEDSGGVSVAVMGCSVNGPGEARSADIGIAMRKDRTGVLFRLGRPFKTISEEHLVEELMKYTEELVRQRIGGESPHT